MGGGAAQAGKELLHGEAAAGHFPEHPLFGLKGLRLERFEVERFSDREGLWGEGVLLENVGAIGYHSAFHPAAGDIGKKPGKIRAGNPWGHSGRAMGYDNLAGGRYPGREGAHPRISGPDEGSILNGCG
jgi:hypothetical protein